MNKAKVMIEKMAAILVSAFILASCGSLGGNRPTSPMNSQPIPTAPQAQNPESVAPTAKTAKVSGSETQPAPSTTGEEPSAPPQASSDIPAMMKDEKDYDWVIYVQDTQKMNGPLKEPITIDLKATNTAGGIEGTYTGSATLKFSRTVGEASVTSVSTGDDLKLVVGPYLTPLVNPPKAEDQPEYSGHGTMSLSNVGTGTVAGESKTLSFKASVSMDLTIKGTQVEMTLKYPMGTVLYHGFIRGEGKK
jgi:hypothetical protein